MGYSTLTGGRYKVHSKTGSWTLRTPTFVASGPFLGSEYAQKFPQELLVSADPLCDLARSVLWDLIFCGLYGLCLLRIQYLEVQGTYNWVITLFLSHLQLDKPYLGPRRPAITTAIEPVLSTLDPQILMLIPTLKCTLKLPKINPKGTRSREPQLPLKGASYQYQGPPRRRA